MAEVSGYLCVKGRSGTGKTLIALHRMLLKARQAQQQKVTLHQAYVARNNHLCQTVKRKFPSALQGSSDRHADRTPAVAFFTMPQLVAHLEECAVDEPGQQALWQAGGTPLRFGGSYARGDSDTNTCKYRYAYTHAYANTYTRTHTRTHTHTHTRTQGSRVLRLGTVSVPCPRLPAR